MSVVDISTVRSLMVEQINLNTSYSVSAASGQRLYDNGLRDMVLSVDGQVALAIINNPLHGRRKDFVASAALTDGAQLPTHIGPLDAVRINGKPADLLPINQVRLYRTNALAATPVPAYALLGTRIFHTATTPNFSVTTADVDYCDYTRDVVTFLCKCSSEYTAVHVAGTLAMLFSVEGEDPTTAGLYQTIFSTYLQMVQNGAMTVPDLARAA